MIVQSLSICRYFKETSLLELDGHVERWHYRYRISVPRYTSRDTFARDDVNVRNQVTDHYLADICVLNYTPIFKSIF